MLRGTADNGTGILPVLRFFYPFAADVFRGELQKQGCFSVLFDFVLDVCLVLCELAAQSGGYGGDSGKVVDDFYPAEHNDTADKVSPVPFFPAALLTDTEGNFIRLPQGIQTVTVFPQWK